MEHLGVPLGAAGDDRDRSSSGRGSRSRRIASRRWTPRCHAPAHRDPATLTARPPRAPESHHGNSSVDKCHRRDGIMALFGNPGAGLADHARESSDGGVAPTARRRFGTLIVRSSAGEAARGQDAHRPPAARDVAGNVGSLERSNYIGAGRQRELRPRAASRGRTRSTTRPPRISDMAHPGRSWRVVSAAREARYTIRAVGKRKPVKRRSFELPAAAGDPVPMEPARSREARRGGAGALFGRAVSRRGIRSASCEVCLEMRPGD